MERFKYNKLIDINYSLCNTNTIGDRIKYYRLTENLTQQKLADKTGLDRTTIVSYEKNKSNFLFKNIHLIADILKVNPSYLYGDYSKNKNYCNKNTTHL